MAAIQTGTGGTFKTSTAEGRLIESICYLQLQEAITAQNTSGRNGVSGEFSVEDLVFSGTYQLPTEQTISTDGTLLIVATSYLQNVAVDPGTGTPTFKSVTLERYVLEVLMFLQAVERDSARNPQNANNITGNYNSDTGLYSGTFSIPVALSLGSDGNPVFSAQEYLLNSST